MAELLQKAVGLLKKEKAKKPYEVEEAFDLLSREDILKKVKTIADTVKTCKKKRLKTFFPASALKTMLQPTVPTKIRREQRRSSQFAALKTQDMRKASINDSDIVEKSSSLSSDSSSSASDLQLISVIPRIELTFETNFVEYASAKQDLDALDAEFIEKARTKIRSRSTQSILPGSLSIFTLTVCRSYVKLAKEGYANEDLIFTREFASINLDEFLYQPTGSDKHPELKLQLTEIKEVIDPKDGKILIIYLSNDIDKAIVIWPLTTVDYTKWSNVMRNLCKLKEIIYKQEGSLPTRIEEEQPSSPIKHRMTIYPRNSSVNDPVLNATIEENSELSLKTDEEHSSFNDLKTEQSWDFNFEELDNDDFRHKDVINDSVSGSEENNSDDEKLRSLTVLANLGKSEGLVNLLTKGGLFLKYGRWGKPHIRHILVTGDLKYVEWWHLNKNKASGHVVVINIEAVKAGRTTKPFNRFKRPERERMSFSLMCKDRTLDLEIAKENNTPVEVWIKAFESLIKQQFTKEQVVRYITKNSSIKE